MEINRQTKYVINVEPDHSSLRVQPIWIGYKCFVHLLLNKHNVMLCYVMLCYVMLCYVMLCYVMLYRDRFSLLSSQISFENAMDSILTVRK